MDLLNTEKALKEYVDLVIKEARKNLAKRNASGKLSKSLKNTGVDLTSKGITGGIEMEYYGEFVDKGVSGVEKKYDTPYSYRSKGGKFGLKGMPPTKKLDKWAIRRKIAPRDKKGRFLPRQSVLFLIARGIFKNGMKPTLFLTKPFEKMRKDLPVKMRTAFIEDAKGKLKEVLKTIEFDQ
jgi:hypothetical protein